MNSTKVFLVSSFIFIVEICKSQNMIQNSDFEAYSSCPSAIGELQKATNWLKVSSHAGTPDYFNVCTASTLVDVPSNAFGDQTPFSGNGYVGINMYYETEPNFREYIQTQFITPLIGGETYTLKFKASLADKSKYSAPCFQFYFSATAPVGLGSWFPLTTVVPQVSSTSQITSKTNWTEITVNYTATGGEQFLTVGNFRNDASTPGVTLEPSTWVYNSVYYYIDDFTMQPTSSLPVTLLSFKGERTDSGTLLNWVTSSEFNNDYFTIESSRDAINFSLETTINGNETTNEETEYSVQLNNSMASYFRLCQIDINGNRNCYSILNLQIDKMNPCQILISHEKKIFITLETEKEEAIEVSIYDVSGALKMNAFYTTPVGNTKLILDHGLSAGIYMLKIDGQRLKCDCINGQRFFVME